MGGTMLGARNVFLSGLVLSAMAALPAAGQSDPNLEAARAAFAAAPVLFVENTGQFDPAVRFRTFGGGVAIDVLEDGLVFGRAEERTTVRFREAGPAMRLAPFGLQQTRISYYVGNDPARWRVGVRTWAGIRWEDVRTGLDLELTGEGATPQWRWVVSDDAPSPPEDMLEIEGAGTVHRPGVARPDSFAEAASKKAGTARAIVYQPITHELDVGLVVNAVAISGGRLWFAGGTYDDAMVGWRDWNDSRFQNGVLIFGGGASDVATAITYEPVRGVAVAGYTTSSNFPLPQTTTKAQAQRKGVTDAFVARVDGNLDGSAVLNRATYAGGSADDTAAAIQWCGTGPDLCIAGRTTSYDLPRPAKLAVYHGQGDAFFLKVLADLSAFVSSNYFGGGADDQATALAVDPTTGRLVIAGGTSSTDFPTTSSALQRTLRGTHDCFVANIGSGTSVDFATYLGGSATDGCTGLVVDAGGLPIVLGNTTSWDLPVSTGVVQPALSGSPDAFVARLTATMNAVSWLTYYGTADWENASGLALDSAGRVYLVGSKFVSGSFVGWLAVLSATATQLLYSSDLPPLMASAVVVPGPVWIGGWGLVNVGGIEYPSGTLVRVIPPGTVRGIIWRDANQNRKLDTLEQLNPLNNYSGVTVSNSLISSTLSKFGGDYSLRVRPSSPQVCITVPSGTIATTATCRTVQAASFQAVSGINFGLYGSLIGSLGLGHLAPSDAIVRALDPLTYRFTWTCPVEWRALHTLDLLFADGDNILVWLRFEEESNTFALFNPVSGQFGPRFPAGRAHRLETPYASLIVPANAVDGPPGISVAITFEARFKPQVAGLKLDILALAEVDDGALQGPDSLGTVNVRPLR